MRVKQNPPTVLYVEIPAVTTDGASSTDAQSTLDPGARESPHRRTTARARISSRFPRIV